MDPSPMLAEHFAGSSYRKIGNRHGVSHEQARRVVLRDGERFIGDLDIKLMVASKYEAMGRTDLAEWPGMVVRHGDMEGWQMALSMFQWAVDQLRARGVEVRVVTRSAPNGVVFMLTTGGQ